MKLDDLQWKLLAAARKTTPDERVPYAFEQRVMARITRASSGASASTDWSGMSQAISAMRAWWIGAAACASIALLAGLWSFGPVQYASNSASSAVADSLDETVLAAALDDGDTSFE